MAEVEVRDYALWLAHIHGDQALVRYLASLEAGATIELVIDGVVGRWRKMADGADGRPTMGLRPDGTEMAAHWGSLQTRRGALVTIMLQPPGVGTNAPDVATDASPVQRAFLLKLAHRRGEKAPLVEARRLSGASPRGGDVAFVWDSTSADDQRLAGKASVLAASDGDPVALVMSPTLSEPTRPFPSGAASTGATDQHSVEVRTFGAKVLGLPDGVVIGLDPTEFDLLELFFERSSAIEEHPKLQASSEQVKAMCRRLCAALEEEGLSLARATGRDGFSFARGRFTIRIDPKIEALRLRVGHSPAVRPPRELVHAGNQPDWIVVRPEHEAIAVRYLQALARSGA